MATVNAPSEMDVPAPWLLDDKALRALDAVVDQEWERLQEWMESELQKEVEKAMKERSSLEFTIAERKVKEETYEKQIQLPDSEPERKKLLDESIYKYLKKEMLSSYRFERNTRKLTIQLEDKSHIGPAKRFAEVLDDHGYNMVYPLGFKLELECLEVRATVELSTIKGGLSLSARPEYHPEATELFRSIRSWAADYGPPKWLKLWVGYGTILVPLAGAAILLLASVIGTTHVQTSAEEARNFLILRHGALLSGDQTKALELLLKMNANYDQIRIVSHGWFKWLSLVVFTAIIVGFFPPHSILAVGRGTGALSRWKFWLKALRWTALSVVVGAVLVRALGNSVLGLFSH